MGVLTALHMVLKAFRRGLTTTCGYGSQAWSIGAYPRGGTGTPLLSLLISHCCHSVCCHPVCHTSVLRFSTRSSSVSHVGAEV